MPIFCEAMKSKNGISLILHLLFFQPKYESQMWISRSKLPVNSCSVSILTKTWLNTPNSHQTSCNRIL